MTARARSHRINPLTRLQLEIASAASRLGDPRARAIAAREAELIPLTLLERHRSRKGEMAKLARRTLKRLPQMSETELLEAEAILRGCAAALDGRFEITDETWLGQRKRRNDQTHAA
jgi:hypothetical protein